MFFDSIPALTLGEFLDSCLDLFSLVLRTVFSEPLMMFFLMIALFLVIFGLLAWLLRRGQNGKL